MISRALLSPGFLCRLAVALGGQWRHGVQERLARSQVRSSGQPRTGCFGILTGKDEMVVRGLAVSLACSAERGRRR
jgi:hypothetical protein